MQSIAHLLLALAVILGQTQAAPFPEDNPWLPNAQHGVPPSVSASYNIPTLTYPGDGTDPDVALLKDINAYMTTHSIQDTKDHIISLKHASTSRYLSVRWGDGPFRAELTDLPKFESWPVPFHATFPLWAARDDPANPGYPQATQLIPLALPKDSAGEGVLVCLSSSKPEGAATFATEIVDCATVGQSTSKGFKYVPKQVPNGGAAGAYVVLQVDCEATPDTCLVFTDGAAGPSYASCSDSNALFVIEPEKVESAYEDCATSSVASTPAPTPTSMSSQSYLVDNSSEVAVSSTPVVDTAVSSAPCSDSASPTPTPSFPVDNTSESIPTPVYTPPVYTPPVYTPPVYSTPVATPSASSTPCSTSPSPSPSSVPDYPANDQYVQPPSNDAYDGNADYSDNSGDDYSQNPETPNQAQSGYGNTDTSSYGDVDGAVYDNTVNYAQ